MTNTINQISNLIKKAVTSLTNNDEKSISYSQIQYLGRDAIMENIYPYGMSASAPLDSINLIFSVSGNEANLAGIPYSQQNRFKNLKPGEVIFGNEISRSYLKFSENKDINLSSQGSFNAVANGIVASRLLATDANNNIGSTDLVNWVHSTTIDIVDDTNGGININISGNNLITSWTPPLYNTASVVSITQASVSVDGYLSSTDWSTFNSKEPAITAGTSAQYWRGDKTWQTLDNAAVGLGNVTNDSQVKRSEMGVALGVATLDLNTKVPVAQLPNSIMEYQGAWDASTNTPTLADGTGNTGDVYRVSVAGTQDLGSGAQTFYIGDFAIYSGSIWQRSPSADIASTVILANDTTTNATMYPIWAANTGANYPLYTSTTKIYFNPSTGLLTATGFSGPLTGNVTGNVSGSSGSCTGNAATATTATNANNVAITNDDTTNATMYLGWYTANTGNLPTKTTSSKLTWNPSTGTLSATTFSGAFSGTAINATNIGITDDTSTNATMYPLWVTANTGNLPAKVSSTKITFNPSTATLTTTTFSGALSGNATTASSAAKWTTARNLAGNSVDGSVDVAFSNKFIVQGTADTGLSGAQFLGALGTGIVKNTTSTGILSIAAAGDFPTLNQDTTGTAAKATAINITNDVATATPVYPLWATANTGQLPAKVSSTKLNFTPSTGILVSTAYSGNISINRLSIVGSGIAWSNFSNNAWCEYMGPAGTANSGPAASITAPSGTYVTSWALRSFIEDTANFGWTWEKGTLHSTTPSVVAELRSSDGLFHTIGAIYADGGFNGALTGNVTGNVSGSSGSCTGNAASATYASAATIVNDVATNADMFPTWVTANTGNLPLKVSSTQVKYHPSTGLFTLPLLSSTDTTDSTSISTGAMITAGGLGVAKNIYTGGNLNLPSTSSTVGQILINGLTNFQAYGVGNLFFGYQSGNYTLTTGSALHNIGMGGSTLISLTTGHSNLALIYNALNKVTTGSNNQGIGRESLFTLTTGSYNLAYGYSSLYNLVSGSYNLAWGYTAGNAYTGSESSNICIQNVGVAGESNVIRIGTQGTGTTLQNKCFIAGIYNTAVGATIQPVAIDSSHQLGASNYSYHPVTDAITAHAGGGQASATQLTTEVNIITVCASLNDSVKLPVAIKGMIIEVKNEAVLTANVYPQSSSYIDGVIDAAASIITGTTSRFVAVDTTHWKSI